MQGAVLEKPTYLPVLPTLPRVQQLSAGRVSVDIT